MLSVKIPPVVSTKKTWHRPLVSNSRLGFEVTAYAGSNLSCEVLFEQAEWVSPVIIDSRFGFEITAYAGKEWIRPDVRDITLRKE